MFHGDIKSLALENSNFRKVIYTGENSQLVVMSIPVRGGSNRRPGSTFYKR